MKINDVAFHICEHEATVSYTFEVSLRRKALERRAREFTPTLGMALTMQEHALGTSGFNLIPADPYAVHLLQRPLRHAWVAFGPDWAVEGWYLTPAPA